MGSNNTPWCIITSEKKDNVVTNVFKYVDNLSYLNYLLEKTPEIVKSQDKVLIKFLYWDWQELQQAGLGPLYDLTINSQINSLKIILSYESFKGISAGNQ